MGDDMASAGSVSLPVGKVCCGGSCRCAGAARGVAALFAAGLMALVLGVSIYAKFAAPNPKQIALDYGVGAAEIVVIAAMLAWRRRWWTWSAMTIFWAGLAGYSFFKSWHGEACGCFAALWEPPAYFSGSLDAVFALVSLGLSVRSGGPGLFVRATLIAAVAAGMIGWQAGDTTTPPKRADVAKEHEGKDAKRRLLDSDLMADLRAQEEGGPAWLIFCFDPECHICEGIRPFMEFKKQEYAESEDPVMRIRMFSIPELEKSASIEVYAWETPTIFVVRDGKITKSWMGTTVEGWTDKEIGEIWEKLADGEYAEEEMTPGTPERK